MIFSYAFVMHRFLENKIQNKIKIADLMILLQLHNVPPSCRIELHSRNILEQAVARIDSDGNDTLHVAVL